MWLLEQNKTFYILRSDACWRAGCVGSSNKTTRTNLVSKTMRAKINCGSVTRDGVFTGRRKFCWQCLSRRVDGSAIFV